MKGRERLIALSESQLWLAEKMRTEMQKTFWRNCVEANIFTPDSTNRMATCCGSQYCAKVATVTYRKSRRITKSPSLKRH